MRRKVLSDGPPIGSRPTKSSVECGQMVVESLERGLRRYGW